MSAPVEEDEALRLDKWLFHARFFKTRALAAAVIGKGRLRVNRTVVTKAHYRVRPGDVLTFPQASDIKVVRVLRVGTRRGPASEAQSLYEPLGDGA